MAVVVSNSRGWGVLMRGCWGGDSVCEESKVSQFENPCTTCYITIANIKLLSLLLIDLNLQPIQDLKQWENKPREVCNRIKHETTP